METFFSKLWADKRFRISCAAVIVICLAAHGFAYANSSFLHDRGYYFGPVVFDSASRAKWMAQFWDCLIYFSYIPWLSGVLVIVMFIASVYMMADLLRIQHAWVIWLIAGISITNLSTTYAHLYWPTEILAALPMAAASAWCWSRESLLLPARVGISAFFMGLSMASYGSYASVGPFLVVIISLMQLIDGEECKKVFLRGLEYIGTFLLGMIFYYGVLRLFLHVQGMQLLNYANENRLTGQFPRIAEILGYISLAYQAVAAHFARDRFLAVIIFLGLILLFNQVRQAKKHFAKPASILLLLFLLAVIPLCAGLIYVLAFGFVHELMIFGYAMPLILAAAVLDRRLEKPCRPQGFYGWANFIFAGVCSVFLVATVAALLPVSSTISEEDYPLQALHCIVLIGPVFYLLIPQIATINMKRWRDEDEAAAFKNAHALMGAVPVCLLTVMFGLLIYQGILTANLVYVKAEQIDTTTKSIATRVMAQIESCEGIEGTETVVLCGSATANPYLCFDDGLTQQEIDLHLEDYGQILADVSYTYASVFPAILKTNANSPLPLAYYTPDIYTPQEQAMIAAMPLYPANGSIKKIGSTIVLKLSEG